MVEWICLCDGSGWNGSSVSVGLKLLWLRDLEHSSAPPGQRRTPVVVVVVWPLHVVGVADEQPSDSVALSSHIHAKIGSQPWNAQHKSSVVKFLILFLLNPLGFGGPVYTRRFLFIRLPPDSGLLPTSTHTTASSTNRPTDRPTNDPSTPLLPSSNPTPSTKAQPRPGGPRPRPLSPPRAPRPPKRPPPLSPPRPPRPPPRPPSRPRPRPGPPALAPVCGGVVDGGGRGQIRSCGALNHKNTSKGASKARHASHCSNLSKIHPIDPNPLHRRQRTPRTLSLEVFLVDHVDHLLRHAQVLDGVAPHIALRQLPEAVAVLLVCACVDGEVG